MKIFRLLQLDAACSSELSLSLSFGDSFLFRHNRIYKNIRLACIASGFSFDGEPDAAYLALPLSQLENIMTARKIPFVNTVGVLQELEKKCPQAVEWFEIAENLKRNFVLHESCHAVARSSLRSNGLVGEKLALMLEESYANTCELFGILEAEDQAHRIFYECNSYTALFDLRTNLKRACEEIGEHAVFQFFMLGYIHSNYLNSSFSENEFSSVQSLVEEKKVFILQPSQVKTVRALVKICFTLDLDFRTTTAGLHMKLNGKAPTLQSADFSYYRTLTEKKEYYRSIEQLTELALKN